MNPCVRILVCRGKCRCLGGGGDDWVNFVLGVVGYYWSCKWIYRGEVEGKNGWECIGTYVSSNDIVF